MVIDFLHFNKIRCLVQWFRAYTVCEVLSMWRDGRLMLGLMVLFLLNVVLILLVQRL